MSLVLGIDSSTTATKAIVVDREGRVAASILGTLPSSTTLTSLIQKVVDEDG